MEQKIVLPNFSKITLTNNFHKKKALNLNVPEFAAQNAILYQNLVAPLLFECIDRSLEMQFVFGWGHSFQIFSSPEPILSIKD